LGAPASQAGQYPWPRANSAADGQANAVAPTTYRIPDARTNEAAQDLQAIAEQTTKVTGLRTEERALHFQLVDRSLAAVAQREQVRAVFNLKQLELQRATATLEEMAANFRMKWQMYSQ
jgi:hypothetical protein